MLAVQVPEHPYASNYEGAGLARVAPSLAGVARPATTIRYTIEEGYRYVTEEGYRYVGDATAGTPISVRGIYEQLGGLGGGEVLSLLRGSLPGLGEADLATLRRAAELGFVDLREAASLLLWLAGALGLRVAGVGLAEDPETKELLFLAVYVDGCGWDEWGALERLAKGRLAEEGFADLAGRVALVCRGALRARRG